MRDLGPLYQPAAIGTLPDDALLEIFSFYVENASEVYGFERMKGWYTLTHVCKRWRNIVFASPRRLNLLLVCTSTRPVTEMLDFWPTLPVVVQDRQLNIHPQSRMAYIIGAVRHRERICQIDLGNIPSFLLERLIEIMQEPFFALASLKLFSKIGSVTVLPDSFLGGSTPRLRSLTLSGVPFPALPKLLLSTNNLVVLRLMDIPHTGYISPEAMVTGLSSATRLEKLYLGFHSPRPRPDWPGGSSQPPSSLTRVDFPALTHFSFHGVNEYIEDFVARINGRLLHKIFISFFHRLRFNILQLTEFIGRIEHSKAFQKAVVVFRPKHTYVTLYPFESTTGTTLTCAISCTVSEWQLSSLAELCSAPSSPLLLSCLERLDILDGHNSSEHWRDDMEGIQWLELLQPLTTVKDLYLCEELALRIARALSEERATEVMPVLENIFVENWQSEVVQGVIGPFIDARELFGYPVVVHRWERR